MDPNSLDLCKAVQFRKEAASSKCRSLELLGTILGICGGLVDRNLGANGWRTSAGESLKLIFGMALECSRYGIRAVFSLPDERGRLVALLTLTGWI